jgi:hypothetical protein
MISVSEEDVGRSGVLQWISHRLKNPPVRDAERIMVSFSFSHTFSSRVDYALAFLLACHGLVIALSFPVISRF